MQCPPPKQALLRPPISRLADVMAHTKRYAFHGVTRLAKDIGVSPSTISRLNAGKLRPTAVLLNRITLAMERELGIRIDPRDLMAENGQFLTRFTCDLVGCRGCYPEQAFNEFGDLKSAFIAIKPGAWVTSQYPHGYKSPKKGIND